jgi:hypothetical protein
MSRSFFLVLLLSCMATSAQAMMSKCGLSVELPVIEQLDLSNDRIVKTVLEHFPAEQLSVAKASADDVEAILRGSRSVEIEVEFYRSQVRRLAETCEHGSENDRELSAVELIETRAGSIVDAFRLRQMSEQAVSSIVPSVEPNLTAKINLVILQASCSNKRNPRLASVLAERGLKCYSGNGESLGD